MGIMPETNEIEVSIFGGSNRPFRSINKTDEIDFIIESCDLQVLDAKVIFLNKLRGWWPPGGQRKIGQKRSFVVGFMLNVETTKI